MHQNLSTTLPPAPEKHRLQGQISSTAIKPKDHSTAQHPGDFRIQIYMGDISYKFRVSIYSLCIGCTVEINLSFLPVLHFIALPDSKLPIHNPDLGITLLSSYVIF